MSQSICASEWLLKTRLIHMGFKGNVSEICATAEKRLQKKDKFVQSQNGHDQACKLLINLGINYLTCLHHLWLCRLVNTLMLRAPQNSY